MEPERKDGKKARKENGERTPASVPESNETPEEYATYRETSPTSGEEDPEAQREADLQPSSDEPPSERERKDSGSTARDVDGAE